MLRPQADAALVHRAHRGAPRAERTLKPPGLKGDAVRSPRAGDPLHHTKGPERNALPGMRLAESQPCMTARAHKRA